MWNLIRWVSPRTIKETFVLPRDYRYPFMAPDSTDGAGLPIDRRDLEDDLFGTLLDEGAPAGFSPSSTRTSTSAA